MADAFSQAERNGFTPGRETVQLGDGYRVGGRSRTARRLAGMSQERDYLTRAADAYRQALNLYAKAADFVGVPGASRWCSGGSTGSNIACSNCRTPPAPEAPRAAEHGQAWLHLAIEQDVRRSRSARVAWTHATVAAADVAGRDAGNRTRAGGRTTRHRGRRRRVHDDDNLNSVAASPPSKMVSPILPAAERRFAARGLLQFCVQSAMPGTQCRMLARSFAKTPAAIDAAPAGRIRGRLRDARARRRARRERRLRCRC